MAARLAEIEDVYRSRYGAFLRVATAIVGEEQLARDSVHDAFVLAVRHRRRFRGEGSLEAWVWRIVVNAARKHRSGEVHGTSAEVAAPLSENGFGGPVRALIAQLPERQRLALFLRYYADLDYAAIGAALDISAGTVAATLNAAHTTLRKRLMEVEQCNG